MKPAPLVAAIVLALVAVAHLLRVLFGVEVTVADRPLPMWPSIVGSIVAALIAIGLVRESRRR